MTRVREGAGRLLLLGALGLALAAAPAVARDPDSGGRPPKVIQLSYSVARDGSAQHRTLQAFAHRAESVTFSVSFDGDSAKADSRFNSHITDTDLHGNDAKHPWVLRRDHDGRKVMNLVRASLDQTGEAEVRVIAKAGPGVDRPLFTIRVADCAQDPPLYPLDCEVGR